MPETIDGLSMDLERMNMDKLRAAFPECFSEGKLDVDKLLSLCGEYVSNDFEKYRFEWKGKAECLKLAQKRSTGTLRPCPEESVAWDTTQNLYIEGDNLEVLKLLQTAYFRKVKMIYIDPPYNTGNDFVYADDFADPIARYKEVTAQTTKSNPETMGRFHTNWLNMMYPRLRLAANLLRDDGVIFISIDDNEVANMRKLCDEAFGEENFISCLIWEKKFAPQNDDKYITAVHDYILVYAKRKDIWRPRLQERTGDALEKFTNPDKDERGVWTSGDLTSKTKAAGHSYAIISPSGKKFYPPEGRQWAPAYETYLKLQEDNRLWFGENGDNVPRQKQFLSEIQDGVVPTTILFHAQSGHNQEAKKELISLLPGIGNSFETPKPSRLILKLLKLVNYEDGDIILDFFSGSATTAHAVMQLNAEDGGNRRFILVQLPEVCDEKSEAYKAGYKNICEIGKERIRRAGAKIFTEAEEKSRQLSIDEEEKPLPDVGFRVFKLDTTNLRTWDATPIENGNVEELHERMNAMVEATKPDRGDLDMVFEIMLKLGIPLTDPITQIKLNGKQAYYVDDPDTGLEAILLACLAPNVTPEDVEAMADYDPGKIVIARESFTDDTAMANAYYILRDRKIELKLV